MATHPFQNFMVRYAAAERIFTEGDLATTMFIVHSGKVCLFRMVEGHKRVYGTMEKGDFFGEMSILEGLPRNVSAEAVEHTELIEINSMTFDKMIRGNIEIAIRMLRKLSIRLREADRRIESLEGSAGRSPAVSRSASPPHVEAARAAGTGPRLEAEDETAVFHLAGAETLVGRHDPVTDLRPDVDLTQLDLKRSVSRRHARISKTDKGWVVTEEVGTLNGTFVNGAKLVTGEPHPLADGDRLGLGMVKLVFRA
jgi:CRP-like cAMP-binding protein